MLAFFKTYYCITISLEFKYSKTSIIQAPLCHFNDKGVQRNEFVRISKLSQLFSLLAIYNNFLNIMVNQLCGQLIILHMLICFQPAVL